MVSTLETVTEKEKKKINGGCNHQLSTQCMQPLIHCNTDSGLNGPKYFNAHCLDGLSQLHNIIKVFCGNNSAVPQCGSTGYYTKMSDYLLAPSGKTL